MSVKLGWITLPCLAVVILSGCATAPPGPSVLVLPAPGKSFEQFQQDEILCRNWAYNQTGGASGKMTGQNTATGAGVGTLIGGGLGAAIGAAAGNPGMGAAVGAGTGLLAGTATGAEAGGFREADMQRRYNNAYEQCMYAKGNQIPGVVQQQTSRRSSTPPPPPASGW